jgi:hypothetical protein
LDLAKLAKGEFTPLSGKPAISVAQPRPNTVGANEPVTFETLMAGWASERRPMQKTLYAYKHALGNLAAFLDHDDATRLSSQDATRTAPGSGPRIYPTPGADLGGTQNGSPPTLLALSGWATPKPRAEQIPVGITR